MEEKLLRREGQIFLSLSANHHLAVLFSSLQIYFFCSISLCEGLILKSLAEKTGFQCSLCYEYIMFYAFQKPQFFSYEVYFYNLPKVQHFSLCCNCRDLKTVVQVRLPLSDVPPHTAHTLDIIIMERCEYHLKKSFLMTFVLQPKSPIENM